LRRRELLVFESLDEPGFEVPKGSVESGESLEQAVRRELWEEAGIEGIDSFSEIGATAYQNEDQRFFLVRALGTIPDTFEHVVSGDDEDAGLRYAFRWLPIAPSLQSSLVQGCDRFADFLLHSTCE
jgi:8-oxo-dGTP pyrophosphatase MutT (NUDIX family)